MQAEKMHPVFEILNYPVSGYAVMGILGFAVSLLYLMWACRRTKFPFDDAAYIFVFAMIGAMLGAKILYLIVSVPEIIGSINLLKENPVQFIKAYTYGGMVFYGGLLGGITAAELAARYFDIDLRQFYTVFVPVIPLFSGFGRIGCLMVGCCYGKETECALHITFSGSPYAPNHVPLIPTQIYEAAFDFALFFILLFIGKKEELHGKLLHFYLASYAVFRFVLEFFRGDTVRGICLLSTSQWISAAVIGYLVFTKMKSRKTATR